MKQRQNRAPLIAVNEEDLINYDKANEYIRIDLNQTINKLAKENAKLKELLKECYPIIDYADGGALSYAEKKLLKQIEEVLNNVSNNNQ